MRGCGCGQDICHGTGALVSSHVSACLELFPTETAECHTENPLGKASAASTACLYSNVGPAKSQMELFWAYGRQNFS